MKRVFVLGGTGFIGAHVLAALRHRPLVRTMVLGHRRVDYRALEDVDLIVGSLPRLDLACLERFRPDTVIHMARLRGRRRLGRRLAARRGRAANLRLLAWLRARAPETHVVYVSGSLVYGDCGEDPTDERAPLRPTGFAREYVLAEEPWMEARTRGDVPVTIVRPPWVVGPGSWFRFSYVAPALARGAIPLYGAGGNRMSFVDVRDCGGMIVHLAEHAEPGRVFNVFAPGQVARQDAFAGALAETLDLPVERIERGGLLRAGDPALWQALTSSFVASTEHDDLDDYPFEVPTWRDMIERNLPTDRWTASRASPSA